jgi:RecB family exonuclease
MFQINQIKGKLEEIKEDFIPDEEIKKFRISVSKYKTFEQCKAKYRFNYIDRLPKKDHDYLVLGKFAHEVLERFYKSIIAGDDRPDHLIMTDAYRASFAIWKEKLTKDQVELVRGMVKQYLSIRLSNREKGIQPTVTDVEKSFQIEFGNEFALIGYIDRVQMDPDGIIRVSDYKTSKDKKYLEKDFFQLQTYAYVILKENPDLKKIRVSYIMLKHNFDEIVKEFDAATIMKVENKFIERYNEIKQEGLYRPNTSILCDYCDYVDSCRDGKEYLIQIGRGKLTQGKQGW